MAVEVVDAQSRRNAVRATLLTDLLAENPLLTTAPHVIARNQVDKVPDPTAIVTLGVGVGGEEGRQGWNGAIVDRFTVDVFVDENAAADPPGQADQITKVVDAALTLDKLVTALKALATPVNDVEASAKRVVEWQDVDEPGPEGAWHKSADFAVEFVKVTV